MEKCVIPTEFENSKTDYKERKLNFLKGIKTSGVCNTFTEQLKIKSRYSKTVEKQDISFIAIIPSIYKIIRQLFLYFL